MEMNMEKLNCENQTERYPRTEIWEAVSFIKKVLAVQVSGSCGSEKICKINVVPCSTLVPTQVRGMQTNEWGFVTWDSADAHDQWASSFNVDPAVIISSLAANCNDLFLKLAVGICFFSTSFQ